jgi:hypothetical protein
MGNCAYLTALQTLKKSYSIPQLGANPSVTPPIKQTARHDKIYPLVGKLKGHHIKRYAFHGIGLAVDFDDNTSVDFDFAYFPAQRHDGFDLWRLGEFVSTRPEKYGKYLDKKKLEDDFNRLIERGIIVNPDISPSTMLYFFKSALTEPQATDLKNDKPWWKFW